MIQQVSRIQDLYLPRSAVTVGGYDGIHLGHRSLLNALLHSARAEGIPAVLITFDPLPFVFFQQPAEPKNIILPQERAEILDRMGFDIVITLPFNRELADLSAETFVGWLVAYLGMESLWIGEDFSLGRNREAGQKVLAEMASAHGYSLHILPQLSLDAGVVSSTRIRGLLTEGAVREVTRLLGYPYFFENEIIHGDRRGRKLGIPTLNMVFPPQKIIPAFGVYASFVWIHGERFEAVTSIGTRPTFYENGSVVVETFILSGGKDEYGEVAKVEFIEYLRPELKFESADALVTQIHTDVEAARSILKRFRRKKLPV